MSQVKKNLVVSGIIFFIVIILFFGGIFAWKNGLIKKVLSEETPTPTETQSSVLSATPDETANWKVYKDEQTGAEFKYPENFRANVWRAHIWPPKLTVIPIAESPTEKGCSGTQLDSGKTKTINGIDYVLFIGSDVGAGSLYGDYCYVTKKDQNYYVLDFVIWSHTGCGDGGCGAYCETQFEMECKNLDRADMIEKPIEKIVSTLKFGESDSETADWKIYKNEEYGFELKYPKDWIVDEPGIKPSDRYVRFVDINKINKLKESYENGVANIFVDGGNFFIYIGDNSEGVSLDSWAEREKKEREGEGYSVSKKETFLNNKPLIELTLSKKDPVSWRIFYVENGSNVYALYLYPLFGDNFEEYKEILEKMLSTFKFTK